MPASRSRNRDRAPAADRALLANSPYAPRSARVGFPSCDRDQIKFLFARYGREANWVLDVNEESSIVAIRMAAEFYTLPFKRAEEYLALNRTLRTHTRGATYALFAVPPGRTIMRERFYGLCWRTWIAVPPSRLVRASGDEIAFTYEDPAASLLSAPESILGNR